MILLTEIKVFHDVLKFTIDGADLKCQLLTAPPYGMSNYIKKYWNLKYDLTTQKESRCPRLKSRDMGNKWSQFRNPILIR